MLSRRHESSRRREKEMRCIYVIVSTAVLELLPNVAVIVAVVFDVTDVVLTVKVTEVFPAGIVTVAGP